MDGAGQTYMVLLRQFLVAQDIAMTIAEFDPKARVIVAADMAEAMQQLGETPPASGFGLAFLDLPLVADKITTLPGRISCILVGEGSAPEHVPDHLNLAGRLDTPFTTVQVLAVLQSFANRDETQNCSAALPT